MAFTHGKNARLWIDQYELTSYFTDFTMAAKAGVAETTVYGKGAKSYIGGLKEGQISGKGFFDPGSSAEDPELTAALGRATNMAVTLIPNGVTNNNTRAIVAYAAETDYSIMNPCNNVVSVSFAAQADSGLSTGVILSDPTRAATTTAIAAATATTVAVGSNGVNTNTFTGAGTLNVASTTGPPAFPTTGTLIVATGGTPAVITYTNTTGTTFTGCTTISGGGALATGGIVSYGVQDLAATASQTGLVCNFHLLTYTYTGTPTTITPKLQHSADGTTWNDLIGGAGVGSFNTPTGSTHTGAFDNTSNATGTGGAISGFVPSNNTIQPYLRLFVTTTLTTTLSTTFFASVARQ